MGTLNSYEVTGSRGVAVLVLLVDLLKGCAAALLARFFLGGQVPADAVAGLAAVLGHNYPVWLRFRGGRGLAPAAGVALVVFWGLIPCWLASWGAGYVFLRRINPASAVACCIVWVTVVSFPSLLPGGEELPPGTRILFATALMAVIALRLVEPVRAYVADRMKRRNSS